MEKRNKGYALPLELTLVILVTVCCFAVNLGGAWQGGPAKASGLAATAIYIVSWALFSVAASPSMPYVRFTFAVSLLTFLSSISSLIVRWTKSDFVFALLLSFFSAVPFYGLRFFLGWTGLYTAASALSACWLAYTWRNLRKGKK